MDENTQLAFDVKVMNNGTWPAEHYAKRATEKIIGISDSTHPEIRNQAHEFANKIFQMIYIAVKQAVDERRARDALLAERSGREDLAQVIRRD